MDWFLKALKNYTAFSGRAQRSEYWYFALFYLLIFIGLAIVDAITGTFSESAGVGLLTGLFALAMLIPSLSVTIRRLHDTDRSGWWLLIGIVPLVGGIVLIVFCAQDGTPAENRFGANPKAAA
jgi:uncharacterized membrane protein YhaH (DUF805 family)